MWYQSVSARSMPPARLARVGTIQAAATAAQATAAQTQAAVDAGGAGSTAPSRGIARRQTSSAATAIATAPTIIGASSNTPRLPSSSESASRAAAASTTSTSLAGGPLQPPSVAARTRQAAKPSAPTITASSATPARYAEAERVTPAPRPALAQALDHERRLGLRRVDHAQLARLALGGVGAVEVLDVLAQAQVLLAQLSQVHLLGLRVAPGVEEVDRRADVGGEDREQDDHQRHPTDLVPVDPARAPASRTARRAHPVAACGLGTCAHASSLRHRPAVTCRTGR